MKPVTSGFGLFLITLGILFLAIWLTGGSALVGSLVSLDSLVDKAVCCFLLVCFLVLSPLLVAISFLIGGTGAMLSGFVSPGCRLLLLAQFVYKGSSSTLYKLRIRVPLGLAEALNCGPIEPFIMMGRFADADEILSVPVQTQHETERIGLCAEELLQVESWIRQGRFRQAEAMIRSAMISDQFEKDEVLVRFAFQSLAQICAGRAQYELAEQHYLRAFKQVEEPPVGGEFAKRVAAYDRSEIALEMATVYGKAGNKAKLIEAVKMLPEKLESIKKPERVGTLLYELQWNYVWGLFALSESRWNDARQYFERADLYGQKWSIIAPSERADVEVAKAILANACGETAEAKALFQHALKEKISLYGSEHHQVADVLEAYAAFLNAHGDEAEAATKSAEARNIRAAVAADIGE